MSYVMSYVNFSILLFFLLVLPAFAWGIGISPSELCFREDEKVKQLIFHNTFEAAINISMDVSAGYLAELDGHSIDGEGTGRILIRRDTEDDGRIVIMAKREGIIISGIIVPITYCSSSFEIIENKKRKRYGIYLGGAIPIGGILLFAGRRLISFFL